MKSNPLTEEELISELALLLSPKLDDEIKEVWVRALNKWITDSKDCIGFFSHNLKKIGKKLKSLSSEEDFWDLFYEIEIGYYLCLHPDFEIVEYQPRFGDARAPDYEVNFRSDFRFYMEVSRIRDIDNAERVEIEKGIFSLIDRSAKVKDKIFEKITQLVEGSPNVLYLFTEGPDFGFRPLERTAQVIGKQYREGNDTFFKGKQWKGKMQFDALMRRLSVVVLRSTFRDTFVSPVKEAECKAPIELLQALSSLKPKGEGDARRY